MSNIKYVLKIKKKDYEKSYWENIAKKDLETIMEKICHNFTPNDFENKKESIIFDLKIDFNKTQTVLDLGCGLGRTCKWVAPQVFYYIGIDHIENMISKAKEYNSQTENAEFMVRDGKTFLPKNSIDIVYSEIAFQHMPKKTQRTYIDDLNLVLKENGTFYVQLPKKQTYENGWVESELDELFGDWNYNRMPVNKINYNPYYTIKASPLNVK